MRAGTYLDLITRGPFTPKTVRYNSKFLTVLDGGFGFCDVVFG
jgi:hypothetical protein